MKTRSLLYLSAPMLLGAAPLLAQLPADPDATAKLVGTWDVQENGLKGTDQFQSDGTFKGSATASIQDKAITITVEGKWSVKDGTMTEVIVKSNYPDFVPVGSTTHDKLIEITDKTFKARTADGSEQTHTRHQTP